MRIPVWARYSLVAAAGIGLFLSRGAWLGAATGDYVIAQKPLYMGEQAPPLMMMVMSRDEQLFNKAYSDYSDLDGDGVLDTTYTDEFSYSGYFDSKLCYTYSNSRFKAADVAGGDNGHSCPESNHWSGNFLNWATMSRLDIVRYVLYGGRRSTDDAFRTVLERASIPNDLHAWVKIYDKADIGQFTPYSGGDYSFCNASLSANGEPQMRVASGSWSEWASTALNQCRRGYNSDTPGSTTDFAVRVEVCDPQVDGNLREEFCKAYGTAATSGYKPVGLLQSYGETGRLRFGMISGSYSAPRSGGVLRRNIGKIAGNGSPTGCAAGDEINLTTGQFCNQNSGDEGIINTLDRFKLTTWNGWTSDGKWADCNDWGILNRQGQGRNRSLNNPGTGSDNCSAWGNPVAEMYAEALRYVANEGLTSTFGMGSDLAGLPTSVAWRDPYRAPEQGGNSYCASCSILVMSSGLPSFDSDEIPVVSALGTTAAAATNEVGLHQGIQGNSYLAGRMEATPLYESLNTHEDVCRALTVTGLGDVRGICPDIPSLEGSYLLAGLAYKARTVDLRPGLQGKPAAHRNTVTTYGVALADNLPKFDIPVGDRFIQLAPLCQAHASGSAGINSTGWRTCALGSVGVGPKTSTVYPYHTYGRELLYDDSDRAIAGSFSLVWEDSLWGNDHDNDVVSMMTYCVGAACDLDEKAGYAGKDICWRSDSPICTSAGDRPVVQSDEVLVRIENLSAYAGNAMLTGFGVSGSNNDGVHRLALRPGDTDGSVLTSSADPDGRWDKPKVLKFSLGSNETGVLENPLWYAAKFGGFNDLNGNGVPDSGEWDTREAGQPDNYFFARDPSKLKEALERIFENAAAGGGETGGGGAGARINAGSFTLSTSFNVPAETTDWTGNLVARRVNEDGSEGAVLWSAADGIPAAADREIFVTVQATRHNSGGAVTSSVVAREFEYSNLGASNEARNEALGIPSSFPSWFVGRSGEDVVSYIRGSSQYEGTFFRSRALRLGDIINSDPEIVTSRDDFGYGLWQTSSDEAWSTLGASYREFVENKEGDPVVYVGANDGMLHAFDGAETGGGRELFAYIPSSSRGQLFELTNPDYDHRYYVDGAVRVSDVVNPDGDWRSVLVGASGAGGRTVFGLDVTTPASFSAGDVRWEIDGSDEEDLGYVLGAPVIAVANIDGVPRSVALFGNGVNSESGLPTLYVVDAWTGQIIEKLQPSDSAYAMSNGLMNIAPVSVGNDLGVVDTVYGGDLQGNLWKFDLSSKDVGNWSVSFGGQPLFTASREGVPQPITGGIEVSRGPGGGVTLFFGTGRYFAEGDNDNLEVQSLYSIWDSCRFGDATCASRIASGRDALVEQVITVGTNSSGYQTRDVSRNFVSYAVKRGWYVDLVVDGMITGERMIGTPTLQSGRVFFTTYVPTARICSAGGGVNWLYGLNMLTGGGAMSGVTLTPGVDGDSACEGADCGGIALNNPNDEGDTSPPTRVTNIFIPPTGTCDPSDPDCTIEKQLELAQCTFVLRAAGADPLFMPRPCGRQSWRQVR